MIDDKIQHATRGAIAMKAKWIAMSMAVVASLAVAGCQRTADREAPQGPTAAGEAQAAQIDPGALSLIVPTPVEVHVVRPKDFSVRANYSGTLRPTERVAIRAEIDGVAERVDFEEGQMVLRGAVLVNIDTRQLKVRRDQAHTDLAFADSELSRAGILGAKGLIPDSQVDQVKNRRDSALHALQTAEIDLQKSVVTAPIAGLVNSRAISQGEFLNRGQVIGELLAVSRLRARVEVPETEVRFFEVGKTVDTEVDAAPGSKYRGVVVTVGAEADDSSHTFQVDIEIDNAEGRLRSGMLARVTATLATYEGGILVPRYAVLERPQGRIVFVDKDGQAERRPVSIGASVGEDVQIIEGLAGGDRLIITGQKRLSPGELVLVVSEFQLSLAQGGETR